MNVLVACEFSGVVRDAFRARGHHAVSCDLLPSDAPGPHYQGDVRDVMHGGTLHGDWDLMIGHPPCRYLSIAANRVWNAPGRAAARRVALEFFRQLLAAEIPKVCIENPVSCANTAVQAPTQIVNPWWFGDPYNKRTCLWLRGLPPLRPTSVVQGKSWVESVPGGKRRAATRSRTFPGMAAAMAAQWG